MVPVLPRRMSRKRELRGKSILQDRSVAADARGGLAKTRTYGSLAITCPASAQTARKARANRALINSIGIGFPKDKVRRQAAG